MAYKMARKAIACSTTDSGPTLNTCATTHGACHRPIETSSRAVTASPRLNGADLGLRGPVKGGREPQIAHRCGHDALLAARLPASCSGDATRSQGLTQRLGEIAVVNRDQCEGAGRSEELIDGHVLARAVCETGVSGSVVDGGNGADSLHESQVAAVRGGPHRLR
jgi:hypothetical protein